METAWTVLFPIGIVFFCLLAGALLYVWLAQKLD